MCPTLVLEQVVYVACFPVLASKAIMEVECKPGESAKLSEEDFISFLWRCAPNM